MYTEISTRNPLYRCVGVVNGLSVPYQHGRHAYHEIGPHHKLLQRDSDVHGQVGELSGAHHDAVCVHGRAEKRDFSTLNNRSKIIFVGSVNGHDAADGKRADTDKYMDSVNRNMEHRAVVLHGHMERDTRADVAYNLGRSGVVGVPVYERRGGGHAAQLHRHVAISDHP